MATLVGIDLGGRTTGRTALAVLRGSTVEIIGPARVAEAVQARDEQMLALLLALEPALIGVDAPLSLPDTSGPDYLYRPGDRALRALSPFTLGELTARALHLRAAYARQRPTPWVEVYPKAVVEFLIGSAKGYKQSEPAQRALAQLVSQRYAWSLAGDPPVGDAADALLALVATRHYHSGAYRDVSTTETPFVIPV